MSDGTTIALICTLFPALGIIFSLCYWRVTAQIQLHPDKQTGKEVNGLLGSSVEYKESATQIWNIYNLIYDGAHSFLYAEYRYVSVFVAGFSLIILVVLGVTDNFTNSFLTMVAFIIGCITSIISGFIGMKIGVFANARTAVAAQSSLTLAFQTSFKAAVVMGFVLCSLGIFNLFILISLYRLYYTNAMDDDQEQTHAMFEAVAGYGLGGSCIGMFGRVGGGIYTKAADVGADLVGKVEAGIPEDDPRNPATIADNVGDNVGDIAGMGADLFGSFAEATCAALVIGSQCNLWSDWSQLAFPLTISAFGIGICFITSFFATHVSPVQNIADIEPVLKKQLLISTVLMTPTLLGAAYLLLPSGEFCIENCDNIGVINVNENQKPGFTRQWKVFLAGACGLWSGLIIGYVTEYYTSHSYHPVREVADACETGAATNIIYGLALGYKSVIIPALCLAFTVYIAHTVAGFYGVAIAALGILSTLSIGLTIDAFGPICDNAGGIAEMAELGDIIRQRTDALDAAGNTTAAIGKGFAIGSAALVSLALFSGFITVCDTLKGDVNLLKGFPFAGLLVGAMLPYWFTAMTMKSVGLAAKAMVEEVRRQFREYPGIMEGTQKPDYDKCIVISTNSSLQYMIAPGCLVMFTPLIVGFGFGVEALAGVLCGALVSGVQMAISQSNTGGAWDNAKKYVESGALGENKGKGSNIHAAAVTGDTVGDPLKDTSGPSINILIKLMAIISLVFAKSFPSHSGGYIGALYDKIA